VARACAETVGREKLGEELAQARAEREEHTPGCHPAESGVERGAQQSAHAHLPQQRLGLQKDERIATQCQD